jgi:PhnB protein
MGNNVHINLEPDTREEADCLFAALAEGGRVEQPMQDMFWGAYFGSLADRFGVHWMINVSAAG